jgi:hypothetical protein
MLTRRTVVIGLPWFLLAAGIAIVIFGFILAGLPRSADRRERIIDPDMDDDEIIGELKRAERIPFSSVVILAGFACIFVSVVWRLVRYFL